MWNTATTDGGCGGCGELLGGNASDRVVWLQGYYLTFSGAGDAYLTADQWLDCRNWLDAYVAIEYNGSSGSSLTVQLQTAVAPTDSSSGWGDVTSASAAMTNNAATLIAPGTLALPPAGVLRLKFSAAGALSGSLRVVVCFKQAG